MKGTLRIAEMVALALIVGAALWLQADALRAPFISDDYMFLDQVRARTPWAALAAPDAIGNFMRPVARAAWFWPLAALGHESPLPFHAANLLLFAAALVLLFMLVRALASARAGLIASAVLGFSHAADVPLRWASGSQDLLALVFALGALVLHRQGRTWMAAVMLGLALLSKETVAASPLIALMLARRPAEGWAAAARRAWPLFAVTLAWAVVWLATASGRPAATAALTFSPADVPATLVHLVQSALGIEWARGAFARAFAAPPPLTVAIAIVAVMLGWGLFESRTRSHAQAPRGGTATLTPRRPPPMRGSLLAGLAWTVLGALPVLLVAPIWSAYFYLFALAGWALVLGVALARTPLPAALAVIVALAWTSNGARMLEEFQQVPDRWSTLSHVNLRYVDRASEVTQRLAAGLRRAWPMMPHRGMVLLAGVPAWGGVQAGGGPLVRWVYRDASLDACYTTQFSSARVGDRPLGILSGSAAGYTGISIGAQELTSLAVNLLMDDALDPARDALEMSIARGGSAKEANYTLAWVHLATGDTATAMARLNAAGATVATGAQKEIRAALAEIARGDTLAAFRRMGVAVGRYAVDGGAHALLADIIRGRPDVRALFIIESFASRALQPAAPDSWRRWAVLLMESGRLPRALAAVDRWFELSGPAGKQDVEMRRLRDYLRSTEAGGSRARQATRRGSPLP